MYRFARTLSSLNVRWARHVITYCFESGVRRLSVRRVSFFVAIVTLCGFLFFRHVGVGGDLCCISEMGMLIGDLFICNLIYQLWKCGFVDPRFLRGAFSGFVLGRDFI